MAFADVVIKARAIFVPIGVGALQKSQAGGVEPVAAFARVSNRRKVIEDAALNGWVDRCQSRARWQQRENVDALLDAGVVCEGESALARVRRQDRAQLRRLCAQAQTLKRAKEKELVFEDRARH